MDEDEDLNEWVEHVYFTGECTCFHDEDDHGWGSCDVEDVGPDGEIGACLCEAGWEE